MSGEVRVKTDAEEIPATAGSKVKLYNSKA
jgi:hypothetical protein